MLLAFFALILFASCTDRVFESCCLETMIDSYIENTSQQERDEFISKFNLVNEKRVKEGILPLDLCTEKYYFDRGWAMEDQNCSIRVEDFENGNVYAIGNRQYPDVN